MMAELLLLIGGTRGMKGNRDGRLAVSIHLAEGKNKSPGAWRKEEVERASVEKVIIDKRNEKP